MINDNIKPNRLGNMFGEDKGTGFAGNVWSKEDISPTITTMQGGGREPHIIEKNYIPCASRGRNKENPLDRRAGIELEQRLEIHNDGIQNTITTVGKDTMVLEEEKMICIGSLQEHTAINTDKIYPTLTSAMGMGGGQTPMIVDDKIRISEATNKGYVEMENGGVADLSYPGSQTRRGRVQGGGRISPTITSATFGVHKIDKDISKEELIDRYKIRKLTPREVFRLMDVTDEDFEKMEEVNSNTQLYKTAGNSIVVNCLTAIFGQLFEDKEDVYKMYE